MCNKQDKDGNHQDMLMDQPESDMYVCSYESDSYSEGETRIKRIFLDHTSFQAPLKKMHIEYNFKIPQWWQLVKEVTLILLHVW